MTAEFHNAIEDSDLFEVPAKAARIRRLTNQPVNRVTGPRIEFYDNGVSPKRPKTQYGIVIHRGNSMGQRWNVNWEVQTEQQIRDEVQADFRLTDHANARAMLQNFDEFRAAAATELAPDTQVLFALGLHNWNVGGTENYQLARDNALSAILIQEPSRAPIVIVRLAGVEQQIGQADWIAVNNTRNPNLRWVYPLR